MNRLFFIYLTRALNHSCSAAVEFIAEEHSDIACACESERKANAQKFAMLRQAAMFVVAFAAENCDGEALAFAANEFKFWAQNAADWARELSEIH